MNGPEHTKPSTDTKLSGDAELSGEATGGHEYRVLATRGVYSGAIFSVYADEIVMPEGATAVREYTRNFGAVGVVAIDEEGRIVLIRQYRHPVGRHLWELPAGLSDVEGEDDQVTAARELAEEADLTAARWSHLIDLHTSPGFTNERIRLFLAQGLAELPVDERHEREHEEAGLIVRRVPVAEAVSMVLRGEITNASAVAGILAAHVKAAALEDVADLTGR